MTDHSNSASSVVSVPVRQIIVAGSRRPLDEDKLRQMGQSIETLGVLQPVLVVKRRVENGEEQVHLVAGRHRLARPMHDEAYFASDCGGRNRTLRPAGSA
jgi:hypothetical protein